MVSVSRFIWSYLKTSSLKTDKRGLHSALKSSLHVIPPQLLFLTSMIFLLQMKRTVVEGLVAMLKAVRVGPEPALYCTNNRLDGFGHFPAMFEGNNRRRCISHMVARKTRTFCVKCKVPLCIDKNCWVLWHTEQDYLFDDPSCFGKKIYRKKSKY